MDKGEHILPRARKNREMLRLSVEMKQPNIPCFRFILYGTGFQQFFKALPKRISIRLAAVIPHVAEMKGLPAAAAQAQCL